DGGWGDDRRRPIGEDEAEARINTEPKKDFLVEEIHRPEVLNAGHPVVVGDELPDLTENLGNRDAPDGGEARPDKLGSADQHSDVHTIDELVEEEWALVERAGIAVVEREDARVPVAITE